MIDTGLVVEALRARGHAVGHVIPVPENAGEWEFEVDGALLSLAEARGLMEADDAGVDPVPREDYVEVVDEGGQAEALPADEVDEI